MPMVGGKKYPYTKEGKEAAAKARKGYAKGGAGFAKPHNYFAGGSVTNNLKSK